MRLCKKCRTKRAIKKSEYCLDCIPKAEWEGRNLASIMTNELAIGMVLVFILGFAVGWVARALFLSMVS